MRDWWCVKEKKKQKMVLLLVTITMMLLFQMRGCVGCVESERVGLLELKSYLNSLLSPKEESVLKSWSDDDSTSDCCLWEMVNCSDAIGGHITHLSLDGIIFMYDDVSGSLNLSLLHSFPQLQSLNFSWNGFDNLFDPIHGYKSFQRLEKLRTLDFSGNHLNNSVLPFLSAAKSLRTLNLGSNDLESVSPPQGYKSFQRLEKLRILDLSGNDLNNSVLPYLSAAKSLRTLNLGYNNLEGVFPPKEFANMTELKVLDLHYNRFSLFSAQGLSNFRELEEVYLSDNNIHSVQPGYKSFQRLEKLRVLDLSFNHLNNSIFPFLGATRLLRTLDLGYNKLEGVFPPNGLEHLVELKVLRLGNNNFNDTGPIQVFKNMPKLEELDLSSNNFTDLGFMFPSSLQVLSLRRNQLSLTPKGYSRICRLKNLHELDLSANALTSMPYCLGNLTHLRTLELSNNQLDGDLSSFVSIQRSSLEYLSLLHNNFNGTFSFNSLANHTRLQVFKLSSYVGMIQPQSRSSWVPLFQLKILMLHNFSLGSTIHAFLIHQRDLCFVDLSNNNLKGAFPTWLVQNNTRLNSLYLNSNFLTKLQLPRLPHGLEALDISRNRIFGSVQEDIGIVFSNLKYMNFASNRFQGAIPSSMGEMKSLDTLDMSDNGLSGKLPTTFLRSCYSLWSLTLSNNKFQGEIFPEQANLTGLYSLALDGNIFNGSLGKGLLNSKILGFLDISNNNISGSLPLWIGRCNFAYLNIRGNQFEGSFPRQLHQIQYLTVLEISHNRFSGSIPQKFEFPQLEELRLQRNEFTGTIPDTLFKSDNLRVLNLGNNNFSGQIPKTIGEGSHLRVLLLGNNVLQSHIPETICQLSKINLLDLSHNKIIGIIPSCFGNMSFSAERDGEYATLSSIRLSWQNWEYTSALHFDLEQAFLMPSEPTFGVEFIMKTRYETYEGDISRCLYGLDLSNNQLSGEIPVELGNLHYILTLNLSSNHLTGSIPNSFSKLKDLESLDISNNKLDGRIPPQLANLDNLGFFNVSCNNLSGEIPFKSHLVTFDEGSYIGNAHLCGHPTNKSCNPMSATNEEEQEEEEEEGEGVIDMEWFYWTCGAVYISTAVASLAFLCIDTHWSRGWFYRVDLMVHHLHRFKGRFV